jgi:hypothetical protein
MPNLVNRIPGDFFYGASQHHPPRCKDGALLDIDAKHYYEIIYFPSLGTNMNAEFLVLWALMFLVNSLKLKKLQIIGDSKVVMKWVNKKIQVQVVWLQPLLRKIQAFLDELEWFSCAHIYKDMNFNDNQLSKDTLLLNQGAFILQKFHDDCFIDDMSFLL